MVFYLLRHIYLRVIKRMSAKEVQRLYDMEGGDIEEIPTGLEK